MSWKRLQDKNLQERLKMRTRIVQAIREFFIKEGFLEVETPILVPYPGQEPYLNPMKVEFVTCNSEGAQRPNNPAHKNTGPFAYAQDGSYLHGYLITSPEYAHKKILAAGFDKIFEITRAFRAGEPIGGLHNPEFTILEWYRAGVDYTKIMEDVERMVQFIKLQITSTKSQIDFSSPWERLTVSAAFEKYTRIPNATLISDRKLVSRYCKARGYAMKNTDTYEDLFFKIFLTEIEPKLGYPKPTILYEYPARMAALSRIKNGGAEVAERFELYIAGMEMANAFSELTNAPEQHQRFLEEQKLRKELGKEIIPLDEDFLDAVAHLPPCAGIAWGVDRLTMLLTGAPRIEDVLTFPAGELWQDLPEIL